MTFKDDLIEIVDRHTGEWKAGHNHLIVDQILALIKKRLPEKLNNLPIDDFNRTDEELRLKRAELAGFMEGFNACLEQFKKELENES